MFQSSSTSDPCSSLKGKLDIWPAIGACSPTICCFRVTDAIAFQVVDVINHEAEIDEYYVGKFNGGVVRPFLNWETQYIQNRNQSAVTNGEH
jgi:hypothetical protein